MADIICENSLVNIPTCYRMVTLQLRVSAILRMCVQSRSLLCSSAAASKHTQPTMAAKDQLKQAVSDAMAPIADKQLSEVTSPAAEPAAEPAPPADALPIVEPWKTESVDENIVYSDVASVLDFQLSHWNY